MTQFEPTLGLRLDSNVDILVANTKCIISLPGLPDQEEKLRGEHVKAILDLLKSQNGN